MPDRPGHRETPPRAVRAQAPGFRGRSSRRTGRSGRLSAFAQSLAAVGAEGVEPGLDLRGRLEAGTLINGRADVDGVGTKALSRAGVVRANTPGEDRAVERGVALHQRPVETLPAAA